MLANKHNNIGVSGNIQGHGGGELGAPTFVTREPDQGIDVARELAATERVDGDRDRARVGHEIFDVLGE